MLYSETVFRETADPKERWDRLRGMLREVSRLRREDHRAARVAIERERWQSEVDRRQQEQSEKERKLAKARVLAPVFARAEANALAKVLGGDAEAKEVAAYVMEQQHDLKPGTLSKGPRPEKPTDTNAAVAKGPALKKEAIATAQAGKGAAAAARRRQRNRRHSAPSMTPKTTEPAPETGHQPEPDLEPARALKEADATAPVAEETEAPHIAPEKQEPPGEGPETREN